MGKSERRKLRVLFLLPSLMRAGAETQVVNLLNSLDTSGFEPYLLTFGPELDLLDRLNRKRVRFYNYPRKSKFDLTVIKSIADVIVNENIDILHCTLQISLFMGYMSKLFSSYGRSLPLVCAIHTTINESLKGEFFDRILFQYLLRNCNHVIFVSFNQAKYWTRKYSSLRKNSIVIHNGVDVSFFDRSKFINDSKKLKDKLSIPHEAAVISCLAGFRPEKAHDVLIQAFSGLMQDAYLILAGDGQTRGSIEKLVQELNLQRRVRFLGEVDDVRPVLAGCAVSILASTAVEAFSMAMLESMSMGVPVVATDIGGLSEAIIPAETGYLVPPGNPEILSAALETILSDPIRRREMSNNCRRLVVSKFSQETMVKATENIFLQVASRGTARVASRL
jgi:glycosyltransferase involved in cell wall biosynthesis